MGKNSIAFGVYLTQRENRYLKELEEFFGTSNRSEAVRLAIEIAHNLVFSPEIKAFDFQGGPENENTTTA